MQHNRFLSTYHRDSAGGLVPILFPDVIRALSPTIAAALVDTVGAFWQVKRPAFTHKPSATSNMRGEGFLFFHSITISTLDYASGTRFSLLKISQDTNKRQQCFYEARNNAIELKGEQKMPKSKKEKAAGLEKHKQLQREKEMKRKQKKQVALPSKHVKKK